MLELVLGIVAKLQTRVRRRRVVAAMRAQSLLPVIHGKHHCVTSVYCALAEATHPAKEVDDALAKYLGASAKKGINSAQARAAMEAYKATLASQGQV